MKGVDVSTCVVATASRGGLDFSTNYFVDFEAGEEKGGDIYASLSSLDLLDGEGARSLDRRVWFTEFRYSQ
jgi:hypothetical protein